MRTGPSRPVQTWLEGEPGFRQLSLQVDDLVALQRVLRQACQGAPVSVASLADGTLTVIVPAAAWASRLRQLEPSLDAALARHDTRIRKLKFRPPRHAAPPPAPRQPRQPPPADALAGLATLREQVEAPGLQQALDRILARHGGRRPPKSAGAR